MSSWNISHGTIIGPLHIRNDTPNQDRLGFDQKGGNILLTVADGAGSLSKSEIGAEIAVESVHAEWAKFFEDKEGCVESEEKLLELWNSCVDRAIDEIRSQDDFKQYGSTLSLVLSSGKFWVAGTIGDAFAVIKENGEYSYVSSERKEFANYTELLTGDNPTRNIISGEDNPEAFAVSSDGLIHSSIVEGVAHPGFWDVVLQQNGIDIDALLQRMESLGKIDDDTTIVTAVRTEG